MNNNMLVIGGLALLVVVALIGIILLGIDEERREKQPKVASAAFPVQPVDAVIPQVPELEAQTARLAPAMLTPQAAAPAPSTMPVSSQAQVTAAPPAAAPASQMASTAMPTLAPLPTTTSGMDASTPDRAHHLPPSLHKSGPFVPFDDDQSSVPIAHTEDATAAILREELHSIGGEVRLLIQRASEMEQRLNTLSDALTRQQRSQNGMAAKVPMPGGEARE